MELAVAHPMAQLKLITGECTTQILLRDYGAERPTENVMNIRSSPAGVRCEPNPCIATVQFQGIGYVH